VRDDTLRLTLSPRCLPCCAKAMERELQQLRDKAQQQQQQQLERERELEAFRTREREQREKEIEREGGRERGGEEEREGGGQGEAGRKREREAASELQGHAGGLKAARDASCETAHGAGAVEKGGERAAAGGKLPHDAEAGRCEDGSEGVWSKWAGAGGPGMERGHGAAAGHGVCAERDKGAWEMEQVQRSAVLTNTSAERLRVVKALLSAWYVYARILSSRMRALCVATLRSFALVLVSLLQRTRSTGHAEKSEGRMSAGAGRGDGRRWIASALSDSVDGSSGGAWGTGSVMARESVGLFLDGVVPVEVLLKDLNNAVTDSLLAWQKGQSKSGQTGRHAQVVRVRARARIHVCHKGCDGRVGRDLVRILRNKQQLLPDERSCLFLRIQSCCLFLKIQVGHSCANARAHPERTRVAVMP
jgi:hypothetical protein